MPDLLLSAITKSFGQNKVLKGVSLEASEGDIIGLVGQSGCGKSTLLKIIVGYHSPDTGSISFHGRNVLRQKLTLRKLVGYTTQENSFYDKLTIKENMVYYASLYKVPPRQQKARIEKLLTQVGLIDHQHALSEKISGGMKRRLDFAISLIHNPSILILDEPTTGLDPIRIEQFWAIVKSVVKEEKKIVIISSHILSEIQSSCTIAALMDDGIIKEMFRITPQTNVEARLKKLWQS
ncbi:ABC transporter ATP-binding protein [Candidatus Woesearchaeota archaeon]|nr:ABC transporter ATP-binding protein [Candidatus Woesearchaeota archaeon]HIH37307.1 ABC transporter ATP-binding protein [Candidatus Woesearchaeota archaeon]HIH48229.1 ABC transporter ATP-binding protein [Candidatus Woesearchaeota archaeon]HIJ04291.1 ABC transporter ATP-binding protein [Candidatus Woesearchaeota archaeon]